MAEQERKRRLLLKRNLRGNPHQLPYTSAKLNRLMDEGRFPPCVWLGPYMPAWWEDDIETFFNNLPTNGDRPPILWPPRPKREPNLPIEMTYGRTPGGKVIIDPKTGKRTYVLPPPRPLLARPTRRDPPEEPPCSEAAQ